MKTKAVNYTETSSEYLLGLVRYLISNKPISMTKVDYETRERIRALERRVAKAGEVTYVNTKDLVLIESLVGWPKLAVLQEKGKTNE